MEKTKKSPSKLVSIIVVLFLIFTAGLFLLANKEKLAPKTKIAFYGLPENQVKIFCTQIEKLTDAKGKKINYAFINLDTSLPLSSQLKKSYDAVITYMGKSAQDAVAFTGKKADKVAAPFSLAKGMTLATSAITIKSPSGKISCMPLLTDVWEALVNIPQKGESTPTFTDWASLENFVSQTKAEFSSPILFASAEPSCLTDIAGIILLTTEGKDSYTQKAQALKELAENTSPAEKENAFKLFIKENLSCVSQKFSYWSSNNLIPRKLQTYDSQTVFYLMEEAQPSIVFLTLTNHRKVKQQVIENYKSIPEYTDESQSYFPAEEGISTLNICSPTICYVPLSAKKNTESLLDYLMMPSVQERLANITGLAPVLASCQTADLQSSDAQFWVAASEAPVTPLSLYSFSDSQELQIFANAMESLFDENMN